MPRTRTIVLSQGYYYDGKKGLRHIVGVSRSRVHYKRLRPAGMEADTRTCTMAEFSKWMEREVSQEQAEAILLDLRAAAARPSRAQQEGLRAAQAGQPVRGKALTSLIEKGLVYCPARASSAPELTPLGLRVLDLMAGQEAAHCARGPIESRATD